MATTFSCIAARSTNGGIGYNGALPWPYLKKDLKFLREKSQQTHDSEKQNAIIMGRRTWDCYPAKLRPLAKRFNIVLSKKKSEEIVGRPHLVCPSLSDAMGAIQAPPLAQEIESVFILGGENVYKEAMLSPFCDKLYITEVLQEFPCDAFYPTIDLTRYSLFEDHDDPLIPSGILEENGVRYKFTVYKRNAVQSSK